MGPPPQDPAAIERWLAEANPGHYRQLALYLQVLREVLPACVDRAVFQLATQIHPGRYAALSPSSRHQLHRSLAALVLRTTTLLTVEQIWSLAARLQEQRQRRRRRRQRLLVQQLLAAGDEGESLAAASSGQPGGMDAEGPGGDAAGGDRQLGAIAGGDLPPGSVHLGLDLPVQGDPFGWLASSWAFASRVERGEPRNPEGEEAGADVTSFDDLDADEADDDDLGDTVDSEPIEADDDSGLDEEDDDTGDDEDDSSEDDLIDADSLVGEDDLIDENGLLDDDHDAADHDHDRRPGRSAGLAEDLMRPTAGSPGGAGVDGLLPRDPVLLEAWLQLYEQALTRRLRHLSHAINSELMRSGLLPLLLPGSLLDAVLDGRIETLGAAPNLLRMDLPMAIAGRGRSLQATVVLLRCADLELEQPRLRSLRRALEQRRQEGRRMAVHLRRLRRRLQAREAEALWLQDIRSRPSGPGPAMDLP